MKFLKHANEDHWWNVENINSNINHIKYLSEKIIILGVESHL